MTDTPKIDHALGECIDAGACIDHTWLPLVHAAREMERELARKTFTLKALTDALVSIQRQATAAVDDPVYQASLFSKAQGYGRE